MKKREYVNKWYKYSIFGWLYYIPLWIFVVFFDLLVVKLGIEQWQWHPFFIIGFPIAVLGLYPWLHLGLGYFYVSHKIVIEDGVIYAYGILHLPKKLRIDRIKKIYRSKMVAHEWVFVPEKGTGSTVTPTFAIDNIGELIEYILEKASNVEEINIKESTLYNIKAWKKTPDIDLINRAIRRAYENKKKRLVKDKIIGENK